VVRGGSWGHDARGARSAFRFQWYRDDRSQSRGFRFLLRSMVSQEQVAPEGLAGKTRRDAGSQGF
jgi:hypothetical protein